MVTHMTDKKNIPEPPVARPEKRFPKAAVDFVHTLLDAQRLRFEKEMESLPRSTSDAGTHASPWPARPTKALFTADGDSFLGSGWGPLDRGRGGSARRWMAQVGAILFAVDGRSGGRVQLQGGGFLRRRFVDGLTVWVDDTPVTGVAVRRGLNGWSFDGTVGALPDRPYHILKLHVPGSRAFAKGPDGRGSIALSQVRFDGA